MSSMRRTRLLTTSLIAFWLCCISSSLHALPPRSLTVNSQGMAQRDAPAPWIAGWDLRGRAQSVKGILDRQTKKGLKGAYLILCGTWSSGCESNLRFLNGIRGQLEGEGVGLIIVFQDDLESAQVQAWLSERGITASPQLHVLIDRYHRSALRLEAFEVDSRLQATTDQENRKLKVPVGLILTSRGLLVEIVTQAGADLTEVILQSLRFAGKQ